MSDVQQIWDTFRGYLEEMKATVDSLSKEDEMAVQALMDSWLRENPV